MPNFLYIATNSLNKTITGTLDAADKSAVITALTKQGLRPISVKEGAAGKKTASESGLSSLLGGNKVKSDDIVMFTRQLSAMVSAGVPLLRALASLEQHTESTALKKILVYIIKDVEGGAALADALAKYPNTFSDVYINMVRAGEAA